MPVGRGSRQTWPGVLIGGDFLKSGAGWAAAPHGLKCKSNLPFDDNEEESDGLLAKEDQKVFQQRHRRARRAKNEKRRRWNHPQGVTYHRINLKFCAVPPAVTMRG